MKIATCVHVWARLPKSVPFLFYPRFRNDINKSAHPLTRPQHQAGRVASRGKKHKTQNINKHMIHVNTIRIRKARQGNKHTLLSVCWISESFKHPRHHRCTTSNRAEKHKYHAQSSWRIMPFAYKDASLTLKMSANIHIVRRTSYVGDREALLTLLPTIRHVLFSFRLPCMGRIDGANRQSIEM